MMPLIHQLWYTAWRENLLKAERFASQREGYGRAAAIAQAMYVLAEAVHVVKTRA